MTSEQKLLDLEQWILCSEAETASVYNQYIDNRECLLNHGNKDNLVTKIYFIPKEQSTGHELRHFYNHYLTFET
jgi:hypothetical protein